MGGEIFLVWYLLPKNQLETCKYGYDENAKETALIVNGEVIGALAGCNQDEGQTFYSLLVASGVHLNRVVKTFKKSSRVKIKHELADFNVSAMGFTEVWNKKTDNIKKPIIIDLLEFDKEQAKNGDVKSQVFLGYCYVTEDIDLCPLDSNIGFKWFEMAAYQGNADAQKNLGILYSNGQGVAKDTKKSVKWLRKAAEQGDAFSQYHLGTAYYTGDDVPKDDVIAHMWINLAAGNGHTRAKEGRKLLEEILSQRQLEEAYSLARQCYKSNYKDC
jgi:TPR repeat protein